MCSVGFNSQFGMNVKQYQQMQQMRFGTGVRQASFQNQQLSFDTGIFSANRSNPFGSPSSVGNSLNFNGVQYNNKYEMMNSVGTQGKEGDYSLKDNIKSLFSEVGSEIKSFAKSVGKGIKSFAGKVADGAKNLFNKITGKGGNDKSADVGKTLGDIQNAQDKETLNQALGNANQESQAVGKQLQADTKGLKNAETQENKAQQGADKAQQGLDTANQGLDKANKEHDAAKTEVQQAEDGLKTAQTGVASAQQALDAAKAAATQDNPNTAAIAEAERNLQAAKQEEANAQKQLDAAKQKETQAQENVSKSEEQVQNAEQQNTEAKAKVDEAKTNTEQAQAQVQNSEQQSQQIDQGIQQGEQKLEQLESNVPVETPQQTSETPQSTEVSASATQTTQNEGPTLPKSDNPNDNVGIDYMNEQMNRSNLSPEQRAEVVENYNKLHDLQPGQTVKIGLDEYTMDKDGNVLKNGKDYGETKEYYAQNAAGTTINKKDRDNRQAKLDKLAEEYNQIKSKPEQTPEDKAKMKNLLTQARYLQQKSSLDSSAFMD